jgi:hypothetical protein
LPERVAASNEAPVEEARRPDNAHTGGEYKQSPSR